MSHDHRIAKAITEIQHSLFANSERFGHRHRSGDEQLTATRIDAWREHFWRWYLQGPSKRELPLPLLPRRPMLRRRR